MDRAQIKSYSMVAAGALVTNSKIVEINELWAGVPAKFLRQLKKVTNANAPNLFEMMQSPKGYEQVEQMVINKVLHDQMVPAAVIPLLETELEMV
jgi:carbonic anhydrase/acetyltransferase-like protein (isoleucine patch superfamily)